MSTYNPPVAQDTTHAATEQREYEITGKTVWSVQITLGRAESDLMRRSMQQVATNDYGETDLARFAREYMMVLDSLR